MVLEEKIRTALTKVIDPEINQNIVDLGLVYEIKDTDGNILIKMTFTSPQCPMGPAILNNVKDEASKVDGVKKVNVELTFSPPWTPQMASEEIKAQFEQLV